MESYGTVMGGIFSAMSFYMILAWLACGLFACHVANEKDRCGICWLVWGVVFGPMALIATVGLPDKSKPRGIEVVSVKTHVLCPQCDEPVRNEARICKHCHSRLVPLSEQGKRS